MDIILDESLVLQNSNFKTREAVRIIVFDENNQIALYGSDYMLLPGGGIEENETFEGACRRESMEEIGCEIKKITHIGTSREIKSRNSIIQNAHYFTAQLDGVKGNPTSQQSNEVNRVIRWMTIHEATKLLESYKNKISDLSYNARFNIYANLHFLNICNQKKEE